MLNSLIPGWMNAKGPQGSRTPTTLTRPAGTVTCTWGRPDRGAGFHPEGAEQDQSPGGQTVGESGVHGAAEGPAHGAGEESSIRPIQPVGGGEPPRLSSAGTSWVACFLALYFWKVPSHSHATQSHLSGAWPFKVLKHGPASSPRKPPGSHEFNS
ncbi:uncharacterized protein LOC116070190 isoform X1 [Mastomys coucha]|uniref:uncharacterized protein LOC116070190 isoform X1 n=1 Tax=Mastomys coucha TaxID=35658 RepID=UPI00126161BE|nr:uncharacterized protein LOC116070190 isoform X1 [Mastomys coucha]